MLRSRSAILHFTALVIACSAPACHTASNGLTGPDEEVVIIPMIEIDVTKDEVDWRGKALWLGDRSGEVNRVELRLGTPMTMSVAVFNFRNGAIRIDRRWGSGWGAGLYRNGRLLNSLKYMRGRPRPEDLLTIQPPESIILPLSLGATTTDEITTGRYQLVIGIPIPDSEDLEPAPRNLKKMVEVIVTK